MHMALAPQQPYPQAILGYAQSARFCAPPATEASGTQVVPTQDSFSEQQALRPHL